MVIINAKVTIMVFVIVIYLLKGRKGIDNVMKGR